MKTIYIECTHTYATETLTGIQRVVKKVVQAASDPSILPSDTVVVPIILKNNRFQVIDALPDHHYEKAHIAHEQTIMAKWQQAIKNVPRLLIKKLMQSAQFEDVKNRIRAHFPTLFTWLKGKYINFKFRLEGPTQSTQFPLHFKRNDILFMLDASWHLPIWDAVNAAKAEGATVIFAAYDLIPISHHMFCDEHFVTAFTSFYHQATSSASGFIAISASVRDTVRDYLQSVNPEAASRLAFEFFHLGANFSHQQQQIHIRDSLRVALSNSQVNSYLIVSTIEPRKNHVYLLDAFDRLWDQGIRANLIIVGRVGWKVDALMQRLLTHPQLNQQLFLFHDLTDAELSYCYTHARALVFPSVIEGFGLPIIEALQHGLPVIASDIPVHREIAGDLAYYVDLASEQALVTRLIQIDAHGIDSEHQVPKDYHWLSWQDATKILLHKLVQMQQKIADEQSLHTH
jgi:alpha-1,2-rhamnosyltransferase